MVGMTMLDKAIMAAAHLHAGVINKDGQPYIFHVLRVMMGVDPNDLDDPTDAAELEKARIVAVLHDTIEDVPGAEEYLRAQGFGDEIIDHIKGLSKLPEEEGSDAGYEMFIERVAPHALRRAVKKSDLRDNMDLTRLPNPTAYDLRRNEKYKRAYARLEREKPTVLAPSPALRPI